MKTKIQFLILSVFLITLSSCKKTNKSANNDNLYKYKNYVYFTTSGRVSVQEPIKISLAKDVASIICLTAQA